MSEEPKADEEKTQKDFSSGDKDSCPVCLLDDVPLVKSPCHHTVCLLCVSRILAAPSRRVRGDWSLGVLPEEDAHLDVPTRGRCPMCRSEISLFDLVKTGTPQEAESKDFSAGQSSHMAVAKNHSIATSGLKGRVYVENRCPIGEQSIHFPSSTGSGQNEDSNLLPYVDMSLFPTANEVIPKKKYFEPDCHYHEPTRTFHGRLKWGETCAERMSGVLEWEYALTFSDDFQFISRGVLLQKRHICRESTCPHLRCKYPLEGRWKVSWPDNPSRPDKSYVVNDNRWVESLSGRFWADDMGIFWYIRYKDDKYPVLFSSVDVQFESSHNLAEKKIKAGETLEFQASLTNVDGVCQEEVDRMIWTRETDVPESEFINVVNFGTETGELYYHALCTNDDGDDGVPGYHLDNLWGNTFCQGFRVGMASYHFMENPESGAYISYEHERTSVWPPLDNGNPIPAKIWFTETSFDTDARIFRGKIDWQGTHGTSWQGSRWWR